MEQQTTTTPVLLMLKELEQLRLARNSFKAMIGPNSLRNLCVDGGSPSLSSVEGHADFIRRTASVVSHLEEAILYKSLEIDKVCHYDSVVIPTVEGGGRDGKGKGVETRRGLIRRRGEEE